MLTAWPSLDELVVRAREHAPAVIEATGAIGAAKAIGVGARMSSWGNPYLEVVADRGRYTHDIQVLGTLFLPVDVNGQRGARIDEADRLLSWRQMSRSEIQARTMAEAVLAYGDGLVASAHAANAVGQEAEAKSEASWFEQRAAVQDATLMDVSLATAEVSRYVQMRTEAQLRLADARLRLIVYSGIGDLDSGPPAGARPEPPAPRKSVAASSRVAGQGELPMLRSNLAEAGFWGAVRERVAAEKNQPLSVLLYGGRGDYGEARVGAGIGYIFPVARRNQGEIARAEAEQARAHSLRPTLQRVLLARLQSAHAAMNLALEAVRDMDTKGIPAAENAVKAALESFKAGKTELVRVIIARRDLAAVRARRLDLISSAWRSYAEMTAILGELP